MACMADMWSVSGMSTTVQPRSVSSAACVQWFGNLDASVVPLRTVRDHVVLAGEGEPGTVARPAPPVRRSPGGPRTAGRTAGSARGHGDLRGSPSRRAAVRRAQAGCPGWPAPGGGRSGDVKHRTVRSAEGAGSRPSQGGEPVRAEGELQAGQREPGNARRRRRTGRPRPSRRSRAGQRRSCRALAWWAWDVARDALVVRGDHPVTGIGQSGGQCVAGIGVGAPGASFRRPRRRSRPC